MRRRFRKYPRRRTLRAKSPVKVRMGIRWGDVPIAGKAKTAKALRMPPMKIKAT